MDKTVLKFELNQKDVRIKKVLNKEFLELDIFAISDIYPNRNDTAFTSESLEASKHTCYNKPILGSFDVVLNDFREHNGQEKYDKEFETEYWDCSGANDEKILGVIRESDSVEVVKDGQNNWLKISCVLWTYYTYRQVKKLLKSSTKKVSVEVLVDKYHLDDDGIMVIDKFTLTGITILGDKIREGIPGAHLNVIEMLKDDKYSQQVKCLSFAYNQKDGTDTDIKLDNKMSILYDNNNLGGNTVTYREKMELLSKAFAEIFKPESEDCECGFWICDFSDDFIIYRDYNECKYYKVSYEINEDAIAFDYDNKIEQIETFIDKPEREVVEIKGEKKFIDEVAEMYADVDNQLAESVEKFATLEREFEDFKTEYADKKFTVTIDEVEYDIDGVCEKYAAELAQKDADYSDLNVKFEEVNNELSDVKKQIILAAEEKLCDDGCKMIDEEDELDDDDKEEMKKACKNNEYSSIEAVEDDIAKRLYAKKKSNRQKNFKSNIGGSTVKTSKMTLEEYVGK
jgi:hypothetical protein